MAELASSIGIIPQTAQATSTALVRGVRVTLNSSGLVAASAIEVRGDFVTDEAVAASEFGRVAGLTGGVVVPALASEATTVGAAAYSAADGKWSVTSTSAVLMGKWVQAASGNNVLGAVLIETVA